MACEPTGILRAEHGLILKVIGVLEILVDRGREATSIPELGACTHFFRLYTDALHHGKEEDLLFASLEDQGFPRHRGPIAMMIHEHQLGRGLVRQMIQGLDRAETDDGAWQRFEHAARSYIRLMRQHIEKENHGLFDLADASLDEPACTALCAAYDEVCARSFDGETVATLERLANDLVASIKA
jgi:hemerythrin-like domain-containing protein